ncbi:MAG: hypothetical protein DWQ36_06880 [Acidobacteria bacterium]|nr:MAG: hypothetical protein DWQ30_24315 [Acidobacteriota bacterium]REK09271.1 MAG: hypothetical protein DWQ36_06880 [Acidobacteriota bacterium]
MAAGGLVALLLIAGAAVWPGVTLAQAGEPTSTCGCPPEAAEPDAWIEGRAVYVEGGSTEEEERWRYHFVVERSWGAELSTLDLEMPSRRCWHPLRVGRRVLVQVRDLRVEGSGALAESDRCLGFYDLEEAADREAGLRVRRDLGSPARTTKWDEDAFRGHLRRLAREQMQQRAHCMDLAPRLDPELIELRPGEWTDVAVHFGEEEVRTWRVGQSTGEDGNPLSIAGENPTDCWLHVTPQVEARWLADTRPATLPPAGSVLRARDGLITPRYRAAFRIWETPHRVRQLRLRIAPRALGPIFLPPDTRPADRPSSRLELLEVDPPALSKVDGSTMLTARLRVRLAEKLPAEGAYLSLSAQRDDQMLEAAPAPGQGAGAVDGSALEPARWWLRAADAEVDVEYPIAELLARPGVRRPLQLRFAVESPRDGGDSVYLAAMAPLEYSIGSEPPPSVLAPGPVTYEGGDGSSCDQAVVIRGARSTLEGIAAERAWLRQKHPGHRFVEQGVVPASEPGLRSYDLITIQTPPRSAGGEWKQRTVCFDIDDFFGMPLCCADDEPGDSEESDESGDSDESDPVH